MAKQSTLYYDVTQLVHWPGKITGIPRVMHELAIRFQETADRPVVFVTWVKELQEFCEINLATTLSHRGHGIDYLKAGEVTPTPTKVTRMSDEVPRQKMSVQTFAKKGAKKVARVSLAQVGRVSPRVQRSIEWRTNMARMSKYKRVQFKAGDQLFVPWGEWWDPNFLTKMQELHAAGTQVITIIHDIGPMVLPNLSGHSTESLTEYCKKVVPICDLVLVVSKNTKKDLTEWLQAHKLNVPRIEVFRLGDNIEIKKPVRPDDPAFRKSGLKGDDYLLCVGTVEAKKNHIFFYYVYNLAKQRGIQLPKLVILGRKGWQTENTFEIMENDPEGRFVFLLNRGDEELSWAYDHCLFTVLPSYYEGWGIPIAESLARGVPCLSSNTSSMVEIAEGITEHFSPYSPEEALEKIQAWLDPKALKLARERTKQYRQFSWDESFKQVKEYLEKIA